MKLVGRAGGTAAVLTTMKEMGLLDSAGAVTKPDLQAQQGVGKRVAILGAGLAGMTAAYELQKVGYDCQILEAQSRAGGRCQTLRGGDILTELESLAAARAAEAAYSKADLTTLAKAIQDMDAAREADDLRAWAQADDRFHRELVRLGGNARLAMIVAVMRDQVRRARATTLFMRPKPSKSNTDHRTVYQAIAARDVTLAHDTHHAHRRAACKMLVDLLKKHQFHGL